MKKALVIFFNNFLNDTLGCNSYVMEQVKYLKGNGYRVDFFSFDTEFDNFDDFNERNEKAGYPITECRLYRRDGPKETRNNLRVRVGRWMKRGWSSMRRLLRGTDWRSEFGWMDANAGDFLQEMLDRNQYDYIVIHYIQCAEILKFVRVPEKTRLVYVMQDALYLMKGLYDSGLGGALEMLPKEIGILQRFDDILCISADEMRQFKLFLPDKRFFFVPHALPYRPSPAGSTKDIDVLFLGFSNAHNATAVRWFYDEVFPHLKHRWHIVICGLVWCRLDPDTDFSRRVQESGIERMFFAENLDDLYARTRLSMCPLQGGTGMKIKVIDSISRDVPVVTTSYGVDGFQDKTESGLLVADDPVAFAEYIDRMLTDAEFYEKTRQKSVDYFQDHLGKSVVGKTLDAVFAN